MNALWREYLILWREAFSDRVGVAFRARLTILGVHVSVVIVALTLYLMFYVFTSRG